MAPHGADVEQDRLVLRLRPSERLVAPGIPLHRLVGGGPEIGTCSAGKSIGHANLPSLYKRGGTWQFEMREETRVETRVPSCATPGAAERSDEALNEGERCVGDLSPAAVDCQRVPAAGDLDELGHALIALLVRD